MWKYLFILGLGVLSSVTVANTLQLQSSSQQYAKQQQPTNACNQKALNKCNEACVKGAVISQTNIDSGCLEACQEQSCSKT